MSQLAPMRALAWVGVVLCACGGGGGGGDDDDGDGDDGGGGGAGGAEVIHSGKHPVYFDSDGAFLYVADYFSEIYRLDLDGGGELLLTTAAGMQPQHLLVDGNEVFYLEPGYQLHSVAKSGGMAARGVGTFDNQVGELVQDNTWIYASGACCGAVIGKIAKSGGSVQAVVETADYGAGGLVYDPAGALHYATGTNRVMTIPTTSAGGPVELVAGEGTITDVAAFDGWIYFSSMTTGTIKKVPRQAGAVPATVATDQTDPKVLGANATSVYWLDRGSHELRMAPVDGGAVITIASDQDEIFDLLFVGDYVYWVGSFQVMRARTAAGGEPRPDAGPAAAIDARPSDICTEMSTPLGGDSCQVFRTCPTTTCTLDCSGSECVCIADGTPGPPFPQGDACTSVAARDAAKAMCSCFP